MKKLMLFFALICSCSVVFANTINQLIVFGDSLSDNGNLYHYFPLVPKTPPYYAGRFSNGPTWSEILADHLHAKYGVNYDNYAVGGATTILRSPFAGVTPIKLSFQITDYHIRTLGDDRSHVLFIIWIGANDYMAEKSEMPQALVDDVVNETMSNVDTLIGYGGKNFLFLDVPDLSKTPRGLSDTSIATRFHQISYLHHLKIMNAVAALKRQHPDFFIGYVDTYDKFNDILQNTGKYNQQYHQHITNVTGSCWGGDFKMKMAYTQTLKADVTQALQQSKSPTARQVDAEQISEFIMQSPSLQVAYEVSVQQANGLTPCQNPDDYIFWDQIHPTRVTHQILAGLVEEYLLGQSLTLE